MRRKIAFWLLFIFACSASGATISVAYIKGTTTAFLRFTEMHRIEEMRQSLIIAVRETQSDLYTVHTSLDPGLDEIANDVSRLEDSAARCSGCHHTPQIETRIRRMQRLVTDYRSAFSKYIIASADRERTARKTEAAAVGSELLRTAEEMAVQAANRVADDTAQAVERFGRTRSILGVTIAVTLIVSVFAAVMLTRSVTLPIDRLVQATRALAAGELGYSIETGDRTEFGELAKRFNSMSTALRTGYTALQSEIEERKKVEAQLLHDALHDALTGLPNRALFMDRLEHVILAAKRFPNHRYAVLFLDLDRFKVVNDSLGHLVGDHLLVAIGERLSACLRPGDTVARLGGDEFGMLIEGVRGAADALQVASRIQKALAGSVEIEGHEIFVSASTGVAVQSDRYTKPDEVLRDADIAMYQAKLKGKACAEIFDAEMHGSVVDRLRLEADLRRAVEHKEDFLLHYQPIVALLTGELVGLEALIRWRHPARGLIEAAQFVPLAEESGAVVPMGEWAIREALAQLRFWQGRVPALANVTMNVNVSGRQFRRPDCVETLRRIIRDSGVDPRQVAVEVTESVVMDDVEASAAKLVLLRKMGVQIHVDDFGTGYSSLSYLHRFPITAVKIDRSFVMDLPSRAGSEEVVKAIVSIAESLDFDVIAEGVEGQVHVAKLQSLRCRYGQGFFLSRPLPASEVEDWVAERSPSAA